MFVALTNYTLYRNTGSVDEATNLNIEAKYDGEVIVNRSTYGSLTQSSILADRGTRVHGGSSMNALCGVGGDGVGGFGGGGKSKDEPVVSGDGMRALPADGGGGRSTDIELAAMVTLKKN